MERASGESQREDTAFARRAVEGERAAQAFGDVLGDEQAQAGAAESAGHGVVGLGEGIEKAEDLVAAHADAVVLHADGHALVAGVAFDEDADSALVGELDGVADEVDEGLLDAGGVGGDLGGERTAGDQVEGELFLAGLGGEELFHVLEDLGGAAGDGFDFELAGLDLGHVEDVVEDGEEVLGVATDGGGGGNALVLDAVGIEEDIRETGDGGEGRADFVGHGREERALGAAGDFGVVAGGGGGLHQRENLVTLAADAGVHGFGGGGGAQAQQEEEAQDRAVAEGELAVHEGFDAGVEGEGVLGVLLAGGGVVGTFDQSAGVGGAI